MATVPSFVIGGTPFAERLRQVGAEFELEVRQAADLAVQSAQREARLLRDEVEWLQRQLEDERHQSAVRLGLCAELKRQVEDVQDAYTQEGEAREYWQNECAAFEEKHSLLEAKLAALALTEAEARERGASDCAYYASVLAADDCGQKAANGRNSLGGVRCDGEGAGVESAVRAADARLSPGERCFPQHEGNPQVGAEEAGDTDVADADEANGLWEGLFNPSPAILAAAAGGDPAALEKQLSVLEDPARAGSGGGAHEDVGIGDSGQPSGAAALERRLMRLSGEDLHALLMAAARRTKGAAALVNRVVRLWVGQLINRNCGAAVRAAVGAGSQEALQTLLSLGGPLTATAALAATPDKPPGPDVGNVVASSSPVRAPPGAAVMASGGEPGGCATEVCLPTCALRTSVERNQPELLLPLLEGLRGGSKAALTNVRKAYDLAVNLCRFEMATPLGAHLVVELSLQGNARYRRGDFAAAIGCYAEAITLCEDGCVREGVSSSTCSAPLEAEGRARENLVRLRYNLARALHRTDRWSEAREQATAVLELDPQYVNAYALRAQAAMSALDWLAAQSDWDRLMAICSATTATGSSRSSALASDEVIAAWQRRREECTRQLSVGHYEVLELPRLASTETVKRAYRDLARKWHPDKHQHKSRDHQERAARRFNRIQEAYEVLSEESSKRAYDAVMLLREARPLTPGREFGDFEDTDGGDGSRAEASGVDADRAGAAEGLDNRHSVASGSREARRASDPGFSSPAGTPSSASASVGGAASVPRESPRERGRGLLGGSSIGAGGPLPGTLRRGGSKNSGGERGPFDRSPSEDGLLGLFATGALPRDWTAAEAAGLHRHSEQWAPRWSAGTRSPTGLTSSMPKVNLFDGEATSTRDPERRSTRPL